MIKTLRFLFIAGALLAGCSDTTDTDAGVSDAAVMTDGGSTDASAPPGLPSTLGPSDRPADLVVPAAYDGVTPLPVLVMLHGYSASGAVQDAYLGLSRLTRTRGMYMIIPDGTVDGMGNRFWNATPGCCNFGGSSVDDVAYLTGLLDELEAQAPVSDIYFVGHSNGGFMSYRMACELSARVSAIVSLAGSDYLNPTDCVPDQPVSVLQIHGDADATIGYTGRAGAYPSASDTVLRWAERASCATPGTAGTPLDLESTIAGDETTVLEYADGCSGAQAELWTIAGGGHIPTLSRAFTPAVLDWLEAHAR